MVKVGLARVRDYAEVYPALANVIELVGGLGISEGGTIAIKINICDARLPETGAITHPAFLDALLQYLRQTYENLEVYVVESDATVVLADDFIRWFGFLPVLEKWDAKWWNLSKDEIVEKEIDGHYLGRVPVPALLTRAHLISLSKLKTNSLSRMTASLKNQFGCLPMIQKSVFHDHLAEVIADVNLAMSPAFSIVDGIIAMGGTRGPARGVPIRTNVILAGKDPVAVASASARLMGMRPDRIKHIRLAAKSGVGSIKHTLVGDREPQLEFEDDWLDRLQLAVANAIKNTLRRKARTAWRRG